jgi:hypothetical protein
MGLHVSGLAVLAHPVRGIGVRLLVRCDFRLIGTFIIVASGGAAQDERAEEGSGGCQSAREENGVPHAPTYICTRCVTQPGDLKKIRVASVGGLASAAGSAH